MSRSNKAVLTFLIVLLAVSLMVTGCGGSDTGGQADDKVLKVGVNLPLTGPSARTGEEFQKAVMLAFEEIDYKIGDYTVELVWINDQSDPQVATSAYEQAVQKDGIEVSMLGWNSSTTVAIMEPVAKYKIPHIFTCGATNLVDEKWNSDDKYKYYTVKGWAVPESLSAAYLDAINEFIDNGLWEPRNKKIFFISEDTDWGRTFSTKVGEMFAADGWTIVGDESVKPGDTDLYPVLTKIKNSDACIFGGTFYNVPSQSALIKQSRELNINAVTIVDALNSTSEWYELVGDTSNFVLDSAPQYRDTETAKEFIANYEEKYGFVPSTTAGGLQYDYSRYFIQIMNECLEANGKLDSETIFQFVKDNLWTGNIKFTDGVVMESYEYNEESLPDPVVGEGKFVFPIIQWFDGEMNVIWPSTQKTMDFQVPDYAK